MILSILVEAEEYIGYDHSINKPKLNFDNRDRTRIMKLSEMEHRRDYDKDYQTQGELELANGRKSINYKDTIKYDTDGHLDIATNR